MSWSSQSIIANFYLVICWTFYFIWPQLKRRKVATNGQTVCWDHKLKSAINITSYSYKTALINVFLFVSFLCVQEFRAALTVLVGGITSHVQWVHSVSVPAYRPSGSVTGTTTAETTVMKMDAVSFLFFICLLLSISSEQKSRWHPWEIYNYYNDYLNSTIKFANIREGQITGTNLLFGFDFIWFR